MGRQLFTSTYKSGQLLLVLVEVFPQYSKDRLFSFVLCGNVKVNEETVKDHTRIVKKDSVIILYDETLEESDDMETLPVHKSYVSRGGDKLYSVLDLLDVDIAGMIWLDCGCATGGFTQCLLDNNATYVHAVDVAYNALDYMLRIDSRVIVHERTNVLSLTMLDPQPQRAIADLSFRSLRRIASHIINLCEDKYLLALCKPQFEYVAYMQKKRGEKPTADISDIDQEMINHEKNFDGVIRDRDVLEQVMLALFLDLLDERVGVRAMVPAGVKGKQGNQEYFLELIHINYDQGSIIFPTTQYTRDEIEVHYHNMILLAIKSSQ